ncbi:MAG: cytochrome c4 [Burkholderiaceae bacterium]|nr:cytochrome c4 [Burkholderiaceae bacterium]
MTLPEAGTGVASPSAVSPEARCAQARSDRRMPRFSFPTTLLALFACLAPAHASNVDGRTVYERGGAKPAATACATCHGPEALGMGAGGFPRLAGLPSPYVLGQLRAFRSGTRSSPVMQPIAAALSDAERQAVAAYVAKLPHPAARKVDRVDKAQGAGELLALRGAWDRNIPECVACHGPGGVGVGDHFPPLSGQPASYLSAQLDAWRTGTRKNDPDDLMGHIARSLTDAEVKAVAEYFEGLTRKEGEQ